MNENIEKLNKHLSTLRPEFYSSLKQALSDVAIDSGKISIIYICNKLFHDILRIKSSISMQKKELDIFCPANREDWRKWLQKNHTLTESVWLICYKKKTNLPTIVWSDAVDEALCFGWIDSKRITLDDEKFKQLFTKRKAGGTWSKINKEKKERLISSKKMSNAGLKAIETAKENGSWTILDEAEELKIPKDLAMAFKANPGSKGYFLSLSRSVKKMMLQWLVLAKRPETRQKRINEIAEASAKKLKPKQFG
jgi:uncharacterized protein YdeI (YjbR/CyaY-like superfamily)